MIKNVGRTVKVLAAAVVLGTTVMLMSSSVFAAGTCKVGPGTCNIRSTASTSGNKVTSVSEGKELTINSQTTGDDGKVWYKVTVDGSTGYIRSDLVTGVSGTFDTEATSTTTDTTTTDTKKTTTESTTTDTKKTTTESTSSSSESVSTTVNETTVLTAKTNDNVSVREGASTKTTKKATCSSGTEVNVTGEATDSEGKLWYQVSYSSGDKTVDGFIRSDFLEVLTYAEEEAETEEEIIEEPEIEEPVVNTDYEVKYEANAEGTEEWYLYDHLKGTKQSINNIYAVMEQSQKYADADNEQLKTMKIVVIALAVVVLILIIVVTILIFRLRDAKYDDYQDYEEDDDEDYEEDEDDDEDDYQPRRKGFGLKNRRRDEYEEDDDEDEDDDDDYEEERRRPTRRKSAPIEDEAPAPSKKSWPSRGMLDVDDDMEFEFLDLE